MPSVLRLGGLVVAAALILIVIWLGRRGGGRGVIAPMVLAAVGLLAVVVFPDIARWIQGLIGLRDEPSGGIITALIVAVAVAFAFIFFGYVKSERQTQRLRRLIRALSAAQLELQDADGRMGGILVVMAAYNEAESLPAVLDTVPREVAGLRTHLLVVDDASRDSTRRVAQEHGAHVVTHPVNGGQGAALQTGYLIAERIGVDIVVTMDADGQHDPTEMPRLIEPIVSEEADFVVGSRRMGEYERERGAGGVARDAGITVYTRLINLLGGTAVSDVANGYRAIRASRLSEIVFTEDQFHNPELLMGAARRGLRITEVPITIRRRAAGVSKKGGTVRYGVGFMRVIFRSWLR